MKLALCLTALMLSATPAMAETIRLSEPVEVTDTAEVFGAELADKSKGMSLKSVIDQQDELAGETVRITTQVAKVCQKKGCFFIATEGAASARISFVDYSFFVPTDISGKEVTFVGTFESQPVDAARAAHFAEDLGEEPPVTTPSQMEYTVVATSVIVPRG